MSHELISGLLSFLNRSPTPYHAVEGAIGLLANAGFRRLREGDRWQIKRGDRVFVTRADATIAALVDQAYFLFVVDFSALSEGMNDGVILASVVGVQEIIKKGADALLDLITA